MNSKLMTKISAIAAAACFAFSSVPVLADGTPNIEVSFTDVTESDLTTLSGEAKILVSVKGAEGNATIAQMALGFDGDLKYKSIRFLQGENNPPSGVWYSPNATSANADKKFLASIMSRDGIKLDDSADLFVLTFAGESGKTVTLNLSSFEDTYCTVNGSDRAADKNAEITVAASDKANEGKNAAIRLIMDKVTDFTGKGDTGITVTITSEKTGGYTIYNVLDNALHRDGSVTMPTFNLENTVLADDTYTIEIAGIGYVPFKKTGVTFDDTLELSNADFVPGDVNADGKVDKEDKAAVEELIESGTYSEAADFNRDQKVDSYDLEVFGDLPDDAAVPSKMTTPSVVGGNQKVTVTWSKPEDDSVTGYVIKYGTSSTSLTNTKSITGKDTLTAELAGLVAGTTYYVQIAAKNASGEGEYSDIVSAKTAADTTQGGGGGGGGGGGSSSSSSSSSGGSKGGPGGVTNASGNNPNTETEGFTDLGNYEWAKNSVYTLKDKGIISGVSDTEFAPANNIKRGDFILILTRMLSVSDAFSENFADVPETAYYYNAIGSAKAAGIAQGSGDNFMPENSITRQDLITLAYRAFLTKGYIAETTDMSALDSFADNGEISDYARTAMASMVTAGIIKGADGNVNPTGNATRAEVAVMCARMVELMK